MLSRVADAIYWMNRYMERAENVARFVDVSRHHLLDLPDPDPGHWAALVATTGDHAVFYERYGEATMEKVLRFLTFDPNYPNSIISCLRQSRDNARTIREVISSEMWEQVNRCYLMARDAAAASIESEVPYGFFRDIKQGSHLFVGITYLTMTHNEGWHFGRLGRLLERADKTSRIVDVNHSILAMHRADTGPRFDEIHWAALLKSASAFEMYRKRHGLIVPHKVVEFLVLERKFPRSIRYCVSKGERSLHAITGTPLGTWERQPERQLGRLHAELEFADPREVIKGLHTFLDQFQSKLNDVGQAISEEFFASRGDDDSPERRAASAE